MAIIHTSSLCLTNKLPFIGKLWIKQMVIGALLVPAMISITAFFINFIAIYYQAAKAIHFTSMVCEILIFVFIH